MKEYFNYVEKCSKEICYPDKIFLGYSIDMQEKEFVKIYYLGQCERYTEPCAPADVDPQRFLEPDIFFVLENGYDRNFVTNYLKSRHYDDFIDLQEIENFDLRYASYLMYGMQAGDERDWHTIEIVKNALRIIVERVARTDEEFECAYNFD